ncbi:MAG: hypothetical protein ACRDJW_01320 [Thermomicrobiales bacterium]
MAEDRIAKLSQRFTRHAVGRKPTTARTRERRSYYIATDLSERIDQVYRDINHALYPSSVNKSLFLETLIEYGLEHLDELKPLLSEVSTGDDPS